LLVEPHAEIVQSDPRRQASPQTLKLVGPLPPQTESVEEFVDRRSPRSGGLRLPTASSALAISGRRCVWGWTDKPRPVALEPPEVVFGTLEALVGYVKGPEETGPTLKSLRFGEALTAKKVSAACWSVLEAAQKDHP
jgi:hypothetical protein